MPCAAMPDVHAACAECDLLQRCLHASVRACRWTGGVACLYMHLAAVALHPCSEDASVKARQRLPYTACLAVQLSRRRPASACVRWHGDRATGRVGLPAQCSTHQPRNLGMHMRG